MATRILSTLAVAGLLREMLPGLDPRPDIVFEPTKSLLDRIAAGETADVAILTAAAVDDLTRAGTLRTEGRLDVARSLIGLAVRAGAPRPDIATPEALRGALLAAGSVVTSRAGASGTAFDAALARLGIAQQVAARRVVIPAGFTAEPVARGEAECAIQQVSELMVVPGVEVVGPLPDALQTPLDLAAALFAGAGNAAAGAAFLRALAAAATPQALARHGLAPPLT